MIDGIKISLGGEDYIVPPLNFRLLKKFDEDIRSMRDLSASTDPMGELVRMVPVITAALQRNYPDLTEDRVMDLLDLGNYRNVFEAALGVTPELRALLDKRLEHISVGESQPLPKTVQ
jgi:hypothetical protein